MRLLVDAGTVAAQYQDQVLRNLQTKRLQLDELWTWIFCKKRNVTPKIAEKHPDAGDVWLWTALDADSKLMVSWRTRKTRPREPKALEVEFYHCKFSLEEKPGARIDDLYQVCGQAQKSIHWMRTPETKTDLLTHLLRRDSERRE